MIMISYIGGGSECYEKRLSIPCLNELKVINPIFGNLNLIFHLCHPDKPPHPPPKKTSNMADFLKSYFAKKKKKVVQSNANDTTSYVSLLLHL